jgi:hypothetical protein
MLTALEDDLNPLGYDIINKITEIDNLISVNKRVSVQLGIENNGG